MCSEILIFDELNLQEDFQYMAKSVEDGEYKVGYIVVDKPWYSNESMWAYYLYNNKYGGGGLCGGAIDLGLERYIVDRNTIEPHTQIAQIKLNQKKKYYIGIKERFQ